MKLVKIYAFLLCLVAISQNAFAQANLSVQGTVQKSTGASVDDGDYTLKFKLYTTETGGTAVWSESQDNINIVGGVYSVVLGTVTPLTVPFDQTYYLGISVGTGAELLPRARLTSSPYALSLIGQSNIFPSTGTVGVGTVTPTAGNELHVKDGTAAAQVTVEGATTSKIVVQSTTGSSIDFKKGANTASITYDGTNINVQNLNLVFSAGINLPAGQTISHNGIPDWRQVINDDFEAGTFAGWQSFQTLNATTPLDQPLIVTLPTTIVQGGKGLALTDNSNLVLKRLVDLTGITHTKVKIKFTMHITGTPDNEYYFAGLSKTMASTDDEILWYNFYISGPSFQGHAVRNYNVTTSGGGTRAFGEGEVHELTFNSTLNTFAFFVGQQTNDGQIEEGFFIDDVEIWVK